MNLFRRLAATVPALLALGFSLHAEEKPAAVLKGSVSPDGRFAARIDEVEQAEGGKALEVELVEVKSGKLVRALGTVGYPWRDAVRLVWAPDSQRMAFVHRSRRGDWTDLLVRRGDTFEPIELPELPPMPERGGRPEAKTVEASYTAVRWTKANVLLLDRFSEDDDGNTAKMRCALTFDAANQVKATRLGKAEK